MTESTGEDAVTAREHQDELVVEALATGLGYAAAGAVAGISERTVRRRMADSGFAARVSVRRGERVATVTGQLVHAGGEAIEVLRECLGSEADAVRLRAAQLILTLGTQLRHAHELEERLAAVEARSSSIGPGGGRS